jgi:hypothetical protein
MLIVLSEMAFDKTVMLTVEYDTFAFIEVLIVFFIVVVDEIIIRVVVVISLVIVTGTGLVVIGSDVSVSDVNEMKLRKSVEAFDKALWKVVAEVIELLIKFDV